MAGTRAGGLKAAATNREKHGSDFYRRIGCKGGHNSNSGGFASNFELARRAGELGGRMSRRGDGVMQKLDAQSSEVIADLEKPGVFFYEVAEKYSVSQSSLRTWMKRQGAQVDYQSWSKQTGQMTVAEAQERNKK